MRHSSRPSTGRVGVATGRLLACTLLALASGACSDTLGYESSGDVTVIATSEAVVIENDRSAKIVHFVVDAATAALISWIPCVAEDCAGIMPGERLIMPADDITGFGESDHVIVNWWHVYTTPAGELYRSEIRTVIVKYP